MSTFVVAHGAWSSAWAWRKMRPLLRAAGHEIVTPSYTGLGERAHLASPSVDLDTHILDVMGALEYEDLRDVLLVGHSYGGMVATGVADRAGSRIARLIYLDAFVPQSGQSLFDLLSLEARSAMEERARQEGDGWRVPPNPLPPDTPEPDAEWAGPRRLAHPLKAFQQPLQLVAERQPPTAYVYCRRSGPGDVFAPFAARARYEGWRYVEIDASHNPHITAPEDLCRVLEALAIPA
jgi:pimeloyl-ACP methyl ester carboxylesterase